MHEFSPREPDNLSCTECGKGRYHENHRTPQNIAYQRIMGMVGGMIDVRDVRRREIQDVLNELYDAAETAAFRHGLDQGYRMAAEARGEQVMTREQAVLYLKGLSGKYKENEDGEGKGSRPLACEHFFECATL